MGTRSMFAESCSVGTQILLSVEICLVMIKLLPVLLKGKCSRTKW